MILKKKKCISIIVVLAVILIGCNHKTSQSNKLFCCAMTEQHINHEYLDFKLDISSYSNGLSSLIVDKKIITDSHLDIEYDLYCAKIPYDVHSLRISLISKKEAEWMTTGWLPYKNNQVFCFAFNSSNDIIFEKTGFLDYKLPVIDFCKIFFRDIDVCSNDEIIGYRSYPFFFFFFYNNFDKKDIESYGTKQFTWEDTTYNPNRTITFAEKWEDFKQQYDKYVSRNNAFDYLSAIISGSLAFIGAAFVYAFWRKKKKIS